MDEIEFDAHVEDDVLRLMFTACHPVLSVDARVALTLKLVGGLSTEEIARAFLVPTTTMAARITRAKKALADGQRAVRGAGRRRNSPTRLASVLEVVYLIFNEGYAATAGERLDARRAVRGGDAPGPHARRARRPASPRCTGWWR